VVSTVVPATTHKITIRSRWRLNETLVPIPKSAGGRAQLAEAYSGGQRTRTSKGLRPPILRNAPRLGTRALLSVNVNARGHSSAHDPSFPWAANTPLWPAVRGYRGETRSGGLTVVLRCRDHRRSPTTPPQSDAPRPRRSLHTFRSSNRCPLLESRGWPASRCTL